jgi:hypothetical protein
LKIFDKDNSLNETARMFIGRYTNIYFKNIKGLGERIKNQKLLESDLFFLKDHLPTFFAMKGKTFKFELAS